MIYDLHTHSTASDGTLAPAELVRFAHARGVAVLALTDHDTTQGLGAAAQAAGAWGIHLVRGIEISVTWEGNTVHIVGLNIDPACVELQHGLAKLQTFRAWRAEEIGRRLAKAGVDGALDHALAYADGAAVSRTHFARFLVEHGHAKDMRQAFKRFLTRDKPGYVPGRWASLEEAIALIRAAGGQAVLAHPGRYKISATRLRLLATALKECGGAAVEVVSGGNSLEERASMAALARRVGLKASVGSDYHGPRIGYADLGDRLDLPAGCEPVWQDWAVSVDPPTERMLA